MSIRERRPGDYRSVDLWVNLYPSGRTGHAYNSPEVARHFALSTAVRVAVRLYVGAGE